MALSKVKTCTLLLGLSLFLLFTHLTDAREVAEVRQCKRKCRQPRQFEGIEAYKILHSCEAECVKIESGLPYVFQDADFTTLFETQYGSIRVLEDFTQRSLLFRGIENYRMLVLEANPLTFVTPSHWDSDILFYVCQGLGTISLVFDDRRESFNLEKGHLMVVPAGITFYMINRDYNQKLVLSMLVIPIANFGNFASFFGVGGQDPYSFLYAFSTEVLESAFNTSSDRLQIFAQQKDGVIVKASKEQIRALTAEEGNGTNYCLKDFGPCQILSYLRESNEFGKLFMVDPSQFGKLQDLNMYISLSNLTQGSMNVPFISTRVTKVIKVVSGSGRLEMASPSREEGSTRIQYQKISAELRPGMVFVVPPGHPMVLMASTDENLETICLEFNAKGNQKFLFAGRTNIMKNLQKEAKELAFADSAEEVDKVLYSQELDMFLKGPSQLRHRDIATF